MLRAKPDAKGDRADGPIPFLRAPIGMLVLRRRRRCSVLAIADTEQRTGDDLLHGDEGVRGDRRAGHAAAALAHNLAVLEDHLAPDHGPDGHALAFPLVERRDLVLAVELEAVDLPGLLEVDEREVGVGAYLDGALLGV